MLGAARVESFVFWLRLHIKLWQQMFSVFRFHRRDLNSNALNYGRYWLARRQHISDLEISATLSKRRAGARGHMPSDGQMQLESYALGRPAKAASLSEYLQQTFNNRLNTASSQTSLSAHVAKASNNDLKVEAVKANLDANAYSLAL